MREPRHRIIDWARFTTWKSQDFNPFHFKPPFDHHNPVHLLPSTVELITKIIKLRMLRLLDSNTCSLSSLTHFLPP